MEKHASSYRRMGRMHSLTLRNWEKPCAPAFKQIRSNQTVEMGWGRIIFGQTFNTSDGLLDCMHQEAEGRRDITFYLRDPHVVLSKAPDRFFLDPSHTYRLWSHDYRPPKQRNSSFTIRRASARKDVDGMHQIYRARHMVTSDIDFILDSRATKLRTYLIAENQADQRIIGTVTGVDHVEAFDDPEMGASLWCLAVDPAARAPGIGEALVRQLVEHYFTRGRNYVDLSVLHDNREAIRLYEKIGFQRVPVFCVKCKNAINGKLYMANRPEAALNPYARIIIDEARRRGVGVEIVDPKVPLFSLTFGGRSVCCYESLTDLTSAVARMRCDDKRLTYNALVAAGLAVPRQFAAGDEAENGALLARLRRVVVKPARGEQGQGVRVDLRHPRELAEAVAVARRICKDVIIEEYVEGQDVRVIVIGFKFVAAAVRRPPQIIGSGRHSIAELIEKYNRRRMAATGGESRVPIDDETLRCLQRDNLSLDHVLPQGQSVVLRKAANLHTGGTIHDVTPEIHPMLVDAAERAAAALNVPVTGLDLCVPDLAAPHYHIIEANERPGLANHEPQPVPERFIDLLFPETALSGPI